MCKKLFILPLVLASLLTTAAHAKEIAIQWLGGPTILIEFGSMQLLTDPMLGEGEQAYTMGDPNEYFDINTGPTIKTHKRLTALPQLNHHSLSAVLISHSHEDHFDQQARATLSKQLDLIAPVADKPLILDLGFNKVTALAWGKKLTLSDKGYHITITAIQAEHSQDHNISKLLGHGNGYWLEFSYQGWRKSLYWMGDSFLTPAIKEQLKAFGSPDIFIPHMGRVGTPGPLGQLSMGADEALAAINYLQPQAVLPIHHSSYELYLEPIELLIDKANAQDYRINVIKPGAWIHYQ